MYGGAAVGVIALHLATNGILGFHTDELYYLACGRHPALGYVDFPPVVPLLARLETEILGVTPWTLRLLPSLLGGFMVALSGAYVRRLGGSLRLQGIALLTAVAAPYLLGANWVFQIYGNSNDLPVAISPQLSDFYWLPNNLTATDALMVDYQPSDVAWMCTSPKIIAHLTVPYEVQGLEQGAPVTFCQLKAPIPQIWRRLRNFS